MKFLFLDTETTGLQKDTANTTGDEVIQIGGVLTDSALKPIRIFDYLCDTTKVSINPGAQKLHGFTMQFIRSQVRDIYLEQVIHERIPEIFNEKDLIVIGHNVPFDLTMIKQTMRDCATKPVFGPEVVPPSIPQTGRYYIDTMPYFSKNTTRGVRRRSLSNIMNEYSKEYEDFLDATPSTIFDTNYERKDSPSYHNALVDAICCFVIFKHAIWKTKLL